MSRRLVGALLLVLAGVTAVVGTFLPLFWEGSRFGEAGISVGFTTTSWETTTESGQADLDLMLGQSPQFGVPIVIAGLLLAVAAALVLLPEHQRTAARYTAVGATGLLVGAVWSTAVVVVSAMSDGAETDLGSYREEVREGIWVLAAAALIAAVGTVLIHARRVVTAGGPVVYRVDEDDTDTPPFGIPVVTVAQLPDLDGAERRAPRPDAV